jgi:transposase
LSRTSDERRHYSAEEKIRIVLEGLRGEDSIAELCRRQGIAQNLYYRWSKDFLEAGKKRLAGDTARAATSRLSLGLVLCRVWQRTLVIKDVAQIAAIDPTAAGWAPNEMLGLHLWSIAHSSPEDGAAGNVWHSRTSTVGGVLFEY